MPLPALRPWPLLLAGCLIASTAQAQRPSRSAIGFKVGIQGASYRAAGVNYDPIAGGVIGVYAPIWVTPALELQPEILGSAQGTAYMRAENERATVRTFYAQLPLTAKLYLDRTFNLQAGLQFGYFLFGVDDDGTALEGYRPMDMGVNIGLGIDPRRGPDIGLRYYSGLSAVHLEDPAYPTNRTLQLTAGFRFVEFTQRRVRRH